MYRSCLLKSIKCWPEVSKKKAQVKLNTVRKYNKGMGCGSPSQTLSHTLSFQLNREVEAVGLFLEF